MESDGVTEAEWVEGKARYIGDGVYVAALHLREPGTLVLRTDRETPHVIVLEPQVLEGLARALRHFFTDVRIEGFAYEDSP